MTSYRLEVGYQSGSSREEAWECLKEITEEICEHPEELVSEACRFDGKRNTHHPHCGKSFRGLLAEYAEAYKPPRKDLTLRIIENTRDGVDENSVVQYASGGGEGRVVKESLRRAFCRLAIQRMHREGYEVNLTVA